MKKAFNIPSITESLRADVESGKITITEAAAELNRANLLPYIDTQRAADLLHINNPMCNACARCGTDCNGTTCQVWTGCIYRTRA
jgi:hypothetical protein